MQCKFCGNENNENATNCFICGKPLTPNYAINLVNIGTATNSGDVGYGNANAHSINNNVHANRFASDTGGGPAVGPQSFSAKIMEEDTGKKGSSGAIIAILVILLVAALGYYLFFSPYAPYPDLLQNLFNL